MFFPPPFSWWLPKTLLGLRRAEDGTSVLATAKVLEGEANE